MNQHLSKQEVEDYWETLIKKDLDLFVYSLSTNNLATNWAFFFRNKILKLLMPQEVKIGTLEYSKKYCELSSLRSKSKSNYLSIHSVMIRDLIRNLNPNSYCLILDIDAFPLSKYAIKLTFVLAMLKGINGNIQRTNCIDNGDHLFIGPSYICFNTKTIKNLKEKNFWVYGFDGNGKEDFTDIEWKGNNILLFGSEGSGMHKHTSKYADFLVKIEINEKIESLNISNSAAIVFHHLSYLKKRVD